MVFRLSNKDTSGPFLTKKPLWNEIIFDYSQSFSAILGNNVMQNSHCFMISVDNIVNIAEGSNASMHSFEDGYEPSLVPASHAVDGIIPATNGECTVYSSFMDPPE